MPTRTQRRDPRRWLLVFLAAIVAVLTIAGPAGTAKAASPGSTSAIAETRVGASAEPATALVGPPEHIGAGQRLGNDRPRVVHAVATGVAANTGGKASVLLGQAGENAVRGAYDIGPKASASIGGRTRVFDGLTDTTVSEVKNVARQSYTLQLRDSLSYAQSTGRTFDLYVRQDTYLTGPLQNAIARGDISLRFIP